MNNLLLNRKPLLIGLGIFVLVIALLLIAYLLTSSSETNNSDNKTEGSAVVKNTKIDNAKVPKGLPSNLPAEPGTKVLQNFESEAPDGRTQSTRIVTSNEEPRAALQTYIKFFEKLGYKGGYDATSSKEGGSQIAGMVKDNDLIMLVASTYTDIDLKKETTKVEISLTHR